MSFYTDVNPQNVNKAAFATVTAAALGSIGTFCALTAIASKVAAFALIVIGCLGFALSIAAITAYFDKSSVSVEKYMENIAKHSMVTIPAVAQVIATRVFNAVAQAIGDIVYRSIMQIFAPKKA